MSKITNKIYLGNWFDAQNINFLKRNKISHILCCAGELRPMFPNYFEYKHIRANDHPAFNLSVHLDSAADFIHSGAEEGSGVFVHCYAGVSRSTTCLVAYLMKHRNMSISNAIHYVRKKRSIVNPNPGFVHQLRNYSKKLVRKRYLENNNGESIYQNDLDAEFGNSDINIPNIRRKREFTSGIGVKSLADQKFENLRNDRYSKSLAPARPFIAKESKKEDNESLLEGILTFSKLKGEKENIEEKEPKKKSRSSASSKKRTRSNNSRIRRDKGLQDEKKMRESDYEKLVKGFEKKIGGYSEKIKPKIKNLRKPVSRKEDIAKKLGFDARLLRRNMPLIANPLKPTMNYYIGEKKQKTKAFNLQNSDLYQRYQKIGFQDYEKKSLTKNARGGGRSATKGGFYGKDRGEKKGRSGLYNTHFLG